MPRTFWIALVVVSTLVVGCSRPEASKKSFETKSAPGVANVVTAMAPPPAKFDPDPAGDGLHPIQAEVPKEAAANAPPVEKVARKIKYVADIRLVTDDFPKAEEELLALVAANDGFVSFADVSTSPGQPRAGTWKARIPVGKFDAFCKGVAKIAEVERKHISSEDVTAQFYDLENHIKNQKAQEDALRELLKRQTDKMENLLAVQRELSNVRDSIERSEGALRLLANLTDLTTVAIHVQERRKFVPAEGPDLAEKPTFAARAGVTFRESWDSLVAIAQFLALAFVGLTPWLPVLAIVGGTGYLLYRRRQQVPGQQRAS